MRHLNSAKQQPVFLHRKRVCCCWESTRNLDLLEFIEGGFDLLKIEAADAPDFYHWNDTGACPIAEAAAGDIEFLGGLLRGEQFGGVECSFHPNSIGRL